MLLRFPQIPPFYDLQTYFFLMKMPYILKLTPDCQVRIKFNQIQGLEDFFFIIPAIKSRNPTG